MQAEAQLHSNAVALGPQRRAPFVRDVVNAVAPVERGGRVAMVTAGWEEREPEDAELIAHLGRPTVNLGAWGRVEDVFRRDPELLSAMRDRHGRLRELQEIYRLRLNHALGAAWSLLDREGDPSLLEPEREAAIEAVRVLDRHHEQRVAEVHAEFDGRWRPGDRHHVARHREEIRGILNDGVCCLCIAGGHVGVLLHRLRLFDVLGIYGDRPVVAWAGGAMVLAERVVLFHDSPPQGAGNAEVLGSGLGRFPGLVPLPNASRRLRLDDRNRVTLFARRFRPAMAVAMDEGAQLQWQDGRWMSPWGCQQLYQDGGVGEVSS